MNKQQLDAYGAFIKSTQDNPSARGYAIAKQTCRENDLDFRVIEGLSEPCLYRIGERMIHPGDLRALLMARQRRLDRERLYE